MTIRPLTQADFDCVLSMMVTFYASDALLVHPEELNKVWLLRKAVNGVPAAEAMELVMSRLKKVKGNIEFLLTLQHGQ